MRLLPRSLLSVIGWRFLIAVALLLAMAAQSRATCIGAVAGLPRLQAIPASFGQAALTRGSIGLTFLGHASFLLETPAGASLVFDYNGYNVADITPDIVTMNNAHSTHYTNVIEPGIKHVLRGWDPAGGVAHHDLAYQDMRVRNLPTNIREWGDTGRTMPNSNSIFIVEVADLCVVHLSHLHHTLTREDLETLGQVDVLLAPVDGIWTMSHADMLEVMAQVKAPITIPMHYMSSHVLNSFLAKAGPGYTVREAGRPGIVLSRAMLPTKPEILVLQGY
jgi:L-ascorbate metabolism protein UlaG (beta-lactamase superfamily)